MSVALYDLGNGREILESWLSESEGELTPELEQLLTEWDADWSWKAERVALFILEQKRAAEAAEFESDRLREIAGHRNRATESLKAYLQREMERAGKNKVKGDLATIAIQKNPPSVKGELSQDQLRALMANGPAIVRYAPESFTLDRKAVLDTVKAGQPCPDGLTIEQGTSLRIR